MPMATNILCTSLFQAPRQSGPLNRQRANMKKTTTTTNKQTNKKGQDKQKEKRHGRKLERFFFMEEAIYTHNMAYD